MKLVKIPRFVCPECLLDLDVKRLDVKLDDNETRAVVFQHGCINKFGDFSCPNSLYILKIPLEKLLIDPVKEYET